MRSHDLAATASSPAEKHPDRQSRGVKSGLLNLFIVAISLSYAFLDLSIYRDNFRVHPDGWKLYFSGGIQAPWQYELASGKQ